MERVSSMNGEGVYLGPGVSHVADDPLNSAHRHPNKETTKREYGRQSGRVVTQPKKTRSYDRRWEKGLPEYDPHSETMQDSSL